MTFASKIFAVVTALSPTTEICCTLLVPGFKTYIEAAAAGAAHCRSPWPPPGTGRHRCPGGCHRYRQRPAGVGTAQAFPAVYNHQRRPGGRARRGVG